MKVPSKTLVVAATFKVTVDAFQVPLRSPLTVSNQRQKTLPSFTTTKALPRQQSRKPLPFLSQIRSNLDESEEIDVVVENDDTGSDGDGQHSTIVDQLSLEEQKELILRQLNMVDEDEDDSDFDMQQQENDACFRSNSIDDEDGDYYNYYDDSGHESQQNHVDDANDTYYGYDDGPGGSSPRERRQRRQRRNGSTSLGATASELADAAIRIGGKATNVAKKTTERAWQSLVENTYDDDYDDEEHETPPGQRRRSVSSQPSRSNSRPMSRYARERMRSYADSPPRQRTRQRQNVDEFATRRPQDDPREEVFQRQSDRIRRDTNIRASRPPRRPIENSAENFTDGMEPTDETQPPPSRRKDANMRTSRPPRRSIENPTENSSDGMKATDGTQPSPSRRKDTNRRASRQPRRPIENHTDGMEATDGTPPPPSSRRRKEISNKRTSPNESQESQETAPVENNDSTTTQRQSKDPSWKSILEKTSKVASKKAKAIPQRIVAKAEKTAKKAKDMSYKVVSNLLEDDEEEDKRVDPIVMDAVVEAKKMERIVEAEPIPMDEWPSTASWRSTQQQPPVTPNRSESARDTTIEGAPFRPRTRRRQQTTPQPPKRRRARPSRSRKSDSVMNNVVDQEDPEEEQQYYYGLFQLPPADRSFEEPNAGQETIGANGSSDEPSGRTPSRRVYSPYDNQYKRRGRGDYEDYEDMGDEYTDGVDRMGNFVAGAFDTFLWGRMDEDRPIRNRSRRRKQEPNGRQTTDNKTGGPKRHKRSGHWRDRMEEQFDEFLGIHEDGKYYDRWANQDSELEKKQENNRKKNGTDHDPVSFARGEVGRGNRRTKSRPIWENEDSLLSVLFGTDNDTIRRNARLYRSKSNLPFFGSNQGSILRMVQSVLQSVALVAGRVSQWASVRGSLPQPVIVVGLLSALLSARPGKRWQTVLFVTLALRMMGELLHGYMYDDLDFEDDLSVVNHKDDQNSELGDDDFEKYDGSDFM
ncbi:unnamed protein product [Cylindrotheca closterium]|uniref:Uncharacterized protein n=1 Tax=Cylindrotheca closterium TaxID=2856 RepID=A0AAD2G1Q0_9STRA|nr:unnamed protein product [Cylindrotheca closterium]